MKLLILRPEPGASATATKARALGLEPLVLPLFAVEAVAWAVPDLTRFDALLLTSANAVRYGGNGLRVLARLPVAAVGAATAEAARDAGLNVRWVGERGVTALVEQLPPNLRLLHLAGKDRVAAGGAVVPVTVYRAAPLTVALPRLDRQVIALHSPRAARRLAELVAVSDRREARVAAISATAAAAAGDGWREVAIATSPDDDCLLALAASLCHNRNE